MVVLAEVGVHAVQTIDSQAKALSSCTCMQTAGWLGAIATGNPPQQRYGNPLLVHNIMYNVHVATTAIHREICRQAGSGTEPELKITHAWPQHPGSLEICQLQSSTKYVQVFGYSIIMESLNLNVPANLCNSVCIICTRTTPLNGITIRYFMHTCRITASPAGSPNFSMIHTQKKCTMYT